MLPVWRWVCREVYPRVRGGSLHNIESLVLEHGLSPRARGKPVKLRPSMRVNGSIPACAGEARGKSARFRRPAVYPRVRGGSRL